MLLFEKKESYIGAYGRIFISATARQTPLLKCHHSMQ